MKERLLIALVFMLIFQENHAFLNFTLTPEAIRALKNAGFTPQNIAKHVQPLVKNFQSIGVESSKKIAEAVKDIASLGTKVTYVAGSYVAILAVREARAIGGSIKNYFYPDAKKLKAQQEQDFFSARKTLEELLKKNASGKIGSMGIPEACEESARTFALMPGGKDELQNMIDTFKLYFIATTDKKEQLS